MQIIVDEKRCPQNHRCPAIGVCPVGAIEQSGFSLPTIDQEKCIQCEECFNFCPMQAFKVEE